MNYYKFNIGDYSAATRHLTMLEHGAYRLLLDLYYTSEQPIPLDLKVALRKAGARSKDEAQAVETVLKEFFMETDSGWKHSRCETEIAAYQQKAETNRVVGKRGGRPKKETPTAPDTSPEITQTVSGANPEITQTVSDTNPEITLTTNHKPLTNIHSVPNGTGGKPPLTDPNEIIFGYGLPMLTSAGTPEKQARSFLGGLRKHHGDAAVVGALRDCIRAKPLQPLEWLAAALPPAGAAPKLNAQEALEASNRAVAERFLAEEAAHETV